MCRKRARILKTFIASVSAEKAMLKQAYEGN